jgi:hypothetical protein
LVLALNLLANVEFPKKSEKNQISPKT